jgi:hypothetical protein
MLGQNTIRRKRKRKIDSYNCLFIKTGRLVKRVKKFGFVTTSTYFSRRQSNAKYSALFYQQLVKNKKFSMIQ